MNRSMILGGAFFLAACGGSGDVDTSTDELGKTKYHYEPAVESVTFDAGCGVIVQNQTCDTTYGFVMTYSKDYADLTTTVTHTVNNTSKTLDITLDTWSYSQIHSDLAEGPQKDDLGTLGTKVGETYKVTVHDRKGHDLWTGKVATLFHM